LYQEEKNKLNDICYAVKDLETENIELDKKNISLEANLNKINKSKNRSNDQIKELQKEIKIWKKTTEENTQSKDLIIEDLNEQTI
jgi:uncharacterized protein YoxC